MRATKLELRWQNECELYLERCGIAITRTDGVQMGVNDLQVTAQPGVDSSATQVTLQLSQGIAGVIYDVAITIATVGGRTITRDTQILVAAAVG